jgi:hypothetical protein
VRSKEQSPASQPTIFVVGKVLAEFDMGTCVSVTVPSPTEFASLLAPSQDFEAVKHCRYTQVVGLILYLKA